MAKQQPVEAYEPEQEEAPTEATEPQVMQVPIFLSREDVDRMIYENNVMLKQILERIDAEEAVEGSKI